MHDKGRDRQSYNDDYPSRSSHDRISRPPTPGNYGSNMNRKDFTRTMRINGFSKDTNPKTVMDFIESFGSFFNFINNIPNYGSVSFSMYDVRHIIQIKMKIRHQKVFDTKLYCDSEKDRQNICDSVRLTPKFLSRPVFSDQVKNELMTYGDVSNCTQLFSNAFIVKFFDCRVPKAIVDSGPKFINDTVFIPSFNIEMQDPNENNPIISDPSPPYPKAKIQTAIEKITAKEN